MPAPPDGQSRGFAHAPESRRRLAVAGWAGTIIGLMAVVQYLQPPYRTLAWITALDAGHAPLFGVIALAVRRILLLTRLAGRSRPWIYGLAFGLTISLGAVSELLQIGPDRNSDPWDLEHDALGAGAFLLLAATRDRHALSSSGVGNSARAICRVAALGLLLIAFAPIPGVARAYAQRAAAFPELCDFAGTWETHFVATSHAPLEYASLPDANGKPIPAALLRFEPVLYAAFKLLEPYPDWSGYQRLRVVARLESDHPIELVLRINDRWHDDQPADRFSRRLTFVPGTNEFAIPLAEIASAPEDRELDLSAVRRLVLFGPEPTDVFSLYLLELGLD